MLKKLFVTAAAAAAVSVPLAGVAWADPPSDPGSSNNATGAGTPNGNGIGQGGVPDKASAFTSSVFPGVDFSPYESGNSGNIAPGAAFKQGAKVPGMNTPDGYGQFLTDFYNNNGYPGTPDFGPHHSRTGHEDLHAWVQVSQLRP